MFISSSDSHSSPNIRETTNIEFIITVDRLEERTRAPTRFFRKSVTANKCSIAASYEIALNIVKAKKSFSYGVLIKQCAMEMAKQFNEFKVAKKFETITSNNCMTGRPQVMSCKYPKSY